MCELICVTDRKHCRGDFLERVEAIAQVGPRAILLREKDLAEPDYLALAEQVLAVCNRYGVPFIVHSYPGCAARLGVEALHMPLQLLRGMNGAERARSRQLGASCHSLEQAAEARRLGCTYLIAGHIFNTECKRGVPPRGIPFLSSLCREAGVPVYAIGGINPGNFPAVREAGAAGACVMSGLMECENVKAYVEGFGFE